VSDTGYDRRGKELAPDENPSAGRQLLEFVITLVVAFVIAFALRTFVVQPYVVPTGSMLPTIQLGDQLLANKLIYRIRPPEPGDIAVFDDPTKTVPTLIKRVIAVGGETVDVRDGKVWVNGKALVEPYTHGEPNEPGPLKLPVHIPAGDVWMMGDNRTASEDSRWFGPVAISTVRGEGFFVYWPLSRLGPLH
jgi:signal peptidase I